MQATPILFVHGTPKATVPDSAAKLAERSAKIRTALAKGIDRPAPGLSCADYRSALATSYPRQREKVDESYRTGTELKLACTHCGYIEQPRLPRWGRMQEWAVDIQGDVKRLLDQPGLRGAAVDAVAAQINTSTMVIVGHSMGSIIAALALREVDPINPILLVTTGSPLAIDDPAQRMGSDFQRWAGRRRHPWVNVHDKLDFATGGGSIDDKRFPDLLQIRVRNTEHLVPSKSNHSKSSYLSHPPVARVIVDVAEGRLRAAALHPPTSPTNPVRSYEDLRMRGTPWWKRI